MPAAQEGMKRSKAVGGAAAEGVGAVAAAVVEVAAATDVVERAVELVEREKEGVDGVSAKDRRGSDRAGASSDVVPFERIAEDGGRVESSRRPTPSPVRAHAERASIGIMVR